MSPAEHLEVGPIVADVDAPAPLIYQMLAAIGQGVQRPDEGAEVLERAGNDLVCDFWTTVALPLGRSRRVRTRESVRLMPPNRIEYEHLDGPVRVLGALDTPVPYAPSLEDEFLLSDELLLQTAQALVQW